MTDSEYRDYYAKTRSTLAAMREYVQDMDARTLNGSAMRTLVLTLITVVQTLLVRVEYLETVYADLSRRADLLERQQQKTQWLQ